MKDDQAPDPHALLHREFEQIVSRVASMLAAAAAPAPAPRAQAAGGLSALREAAEARREAAMEHRELAMEIVIGALLNEGNAGWDPRNPASCRANYEGKVVQALKVIEATA